MRHNAFTLIELLVSITLFGLITVLLFGTIDNLRHELSFSTEKERLIDRQNRIISLLRTDFDRPEELNISKGTREFTTAFLSGSNRSLYSIDHPYVVWVVLKNDSTLVRLESASPIRLPLRPESLYLTHSDVIGEHCTCFRIYDSNRSRLVYVKFHGHAPIMVETAR